MEEKIKVKVINPFINKYSKEVMEEGKVLEITEKRLNEIEKVSLELVQVIEEEETKEGDSSKNEEVEKQG